MVVLLSCDIITHCPELCGTHSEGSIALLPGEGSKPDFFVNPPGGYRFDLAQDVRKLMGGFQTDEKMHVIGHSSNFLRNAFELIDHPAKKSVEAGTPYGGYCADPVFGAENKMVMQCEVRRGHLRMMVPLPLPGQINFWNVLRWLAPPANILEALPGQQMP